MWVWLLAAAVALVPALAAPTDLPGAVRSGDVDAVRAALNAGADVNGADDWGRSALIVALQQGSPAIVELLLARGASVTVTDAWGRTPLLVATQLKNTAAVRQLIGRRSDVNAANRNDITPLIAAAQTGNREAAELLLAADARIDREDNLGRTALMWAAYRKDAALVKLLLDHGADAGKVDRDMATAFDLARSRNADAALLTLLGAAAPAVARGASAPAARRDSAPTAGVAARRLNPAFDGSRAVRGNAGAPITVFEYTDFQCPYCGQGAKTIDEVMARYEGQIRLVVKHLPLPQLHPMAMASALTFEAISLQGAGLAWAFYDKVFADQALLAGGEPQLRRLAANLGVDLSRLDADIAGPVPRARVAADLEESRKYQFDGVPAFVVEGSVIEGAQPAQVFFDVIDAALRRD